MLAEGSSNKFIARELGLTEGTVKTYVHRLLKLLGASNRTEAALSIARPTLPLKELSVRAASILTQAADSNLT
jgi:DNA-binding NarL/FixJ family response regulator